MLAEKNDVIGKTDTVLYACQIFIIARYVNPGKVNHCKKHRHKKKYSTKFRLNRHF